MEYKSLGSLVKFVGGYSFKSEKYVSSGLRVIRITNVQDGILEDNAPCYYPIEYKDMIGNALLKEGDLLMSLTGNVGRVAFITDEFLPAGLNQRVECFRTDDNIIKKYLFYMFKSKTFIQKALKNATGVAQLNMSTTWLKDYMVPIRNSNEMNSIIKTLESIESAILSEKNAILSYDSLIKSRFNEQFINNPSFTTKKWFEVLNIINGRDYKGHEGTKYPIYGSGGFMGIFADNYLTSGIITIIGRKGTIDKPLLVNDKIWNIDTAFAIKTNEEILNPVFFYYRSKFYDYQNLNKQTTKPSLKKSDLLKLSIELPPMNQQLKFIGLIEIIDKLKFINKR